MLCCFSQSLGDILAKQPDFVITNMVASASLGLELDLYALASKIPEIEYEPEQFPGAILKFKEPKASYVSEQSTLTRIGKTSGNFAGNQKKAVFMGLP